MKKDETLKNLNTEKVAGKQLLPLFKGEKKDYKIIIPEEVEREKSNKKKFIIDMSNEPGTYEINELREIQTFFKRF